MPKTIEIALKPHQCLEQEQIRMHIAKQYNVDLEYIVLLKKSLDARNRKNIHYIIRAEIFDFPQKEKNFNVYKPRALGKSTCHIIGFGPAGIFAALQALQLGIKPIVIERGKGVKERRRDLAKLNKELLVNSESNYCFGEGGAGTYSDGKLYTRSKKKGSVKDVLEAFVQFGANPKIVFEAHPHIGTNKLPGIIEKMREFILANGGEIHFNTKLLDFEIGKSGIHKISCTNNKEFDVQHLILATGHSARDIYELLKLKEVKLEAKSFALGVRIEHPQEMVDQMQYHCKRGEFLPPASYSLVQQVKGRGVFSFCMCPGGIIAPASTDQNETVVNGWSPSKRNGKFANSGLVVQLDQEDFLPFQNRGVLAGLEFQKSVERACYDFSGSIVAPAQKVPHFLNNKTGDSILQSSYIPGLVNANLNEILPHLVSQRLKGAITQFAKKMKGYDSSEGIMVATESRTSSPVRIPRDKELLCHPQVENLYPSAEGAGFAGGIVSAAIDGIRCLNAVAQKKGIY